MVKVAVTRAGRRAGLESAFTGAPWQVWGADGFDGAWSGKRPQLQEITRERSFRRLRTGELKGLLWNLNGSLEAERLDRPLIAGLDALDIPILPVSPKRQEWRMYVTSADVRKYGGSEGCQACTQVYIEGKTNVPLSDACRRRIQELMKGDDLGRARLDASRKRKASGQAFERDAPPMPGVRQESGRGDQSHTQKESTSHGGGDDVEIPAAYSSGDPYQSRMDESMSGGAASSSGQGLKRTVDQAGLPEEADVSHPQGTKRAGLESTGSGMAPDARRQKIAGGTASTTRNDADFDFQVDLRRDENMSLSDDPSSGLDSIASVFRRGEQLDRRDQVVDAFRSDC